MLSIHYGLHLIITNSLFKRPYQLCYKKHQHSWNKSHWVYVWYKIFIPWTEIQKMVTFLNKPKGKKNVTFSILTTNYYLRQKHWKLALNIFCFQPNMMTYVIKIPVFFVWWFDAWWNYSEFIQGYHKTTKEVSDLFYPK